MDMRTGSGSSLKDEAIMLASKEFSKWVLNGKVFDVDHSLDPPWDHSGVLVEKPSDPSSRLAKYKTLGEWMEECFTGRSTPSYVSGCGFYHDTFGYEIEDAVRSLAENLLIEQRGLDKDMDDVAELVADDAVELWAEAMETVQKVSTDFAWEIARFQAATEIL
jgi:hypothetical protein